jgi:hypothetical protein
VIGEWGLGWEATGDCAALWNSMHHMISVSPVVFQTLEPEAVVTVDVQGPAAW